ncbi:MAG: hypothetical protein DIU71_07870 [Proteobacteria bacterium]|nr:MAG: hypothetical protein DIU71_07870 [Pseudomonadota bacterium]
MARATAPTETFDALSLLARDHRQVDRLFDEFGSAAGQQLDPIARRICKMLRMHTRIEEEIFYPAARSALADADMVDRAQREHETAKALITRIEAMTSEQDGFKPAMLELAREVRQHIAEEERELFEALRGASLDLVVLGEALAERRETLMEVMGLHRDDELGAQPESGRGQVAEARQRT